MAIATQKQKQNQGGTALSADRARPSRAFETHEVAAMAWAAVSKFPKERGTAAARFRAYSWRIEPDVLLYALMDVALAGYHAQMFNEQVARERVAKIREVLRDEQKQLERDESIRPNKSLRSIADILGVA